MDVCGRIFDPWPGWCVLLSPVGWGWVLCLHASLSCATAIASFGCTTTSTPTIALAPCPPNPLPLATYTRTPTSLFFVVRRPERGCPLPMRPLWSRGGVEDISCARGGVASVSVAADFEHSAPIAATHPPRRDRGAHHDACPSTAAPSSPSFSSTGEAAEVTSAATAAAPAAHALDLAPTHGPLEMDLGVWDTFPGEGTTEGTAGGGTLLSFLDEPAVGPATVPAWQVCRCGKCAGCTAVDEFPTFDWDL